MAIFSQTFLTVECEECGKKIMLNLGNKNIIKYGFVCPHCKYIYKVDDMWEIALSSKAFFSGK